MDSGDLTAAMGGFFMGQMFAGQSQRRPEVWGFVAIRTEKRLASTVLVSVMMSAFHDKNNVEGDTATVEFTNKAEMKGFYNSKHFITFPMCFDATGVKDSFFCIALRNQIGSPIPLNMILFRNLILKLKEEKIDYELW